MPPAMTASTIGVNLGDLVVDGDDFYGDGVNLASRLEGVARPGGIVCSAAVREQIGNRPEDAELWLKGFRKVGVNV